MESVPLLKITKSLCSHRLRSSSAEVLLPNNATSLSPLMKTSFGTPLVTSCSDDISISSFNLLAPLYIRPIDQRTGEVQAFAAFEWVKDDDLLRNETRLPRLLDCLQQCETDFI